MSVISTHNLSIGYTKPLYKKLNLSSENGKLIALIGPNGVGKTTLIKTLSGLQRPLSGTIKLNNAPIEELSNQNIAEQVSLVLTNQSPSNTIVEDFVGLGRIPRTGFFGKLKGQDYTIIEEVMRLVNCLNFNSRKLNELSDGQRQRVNIARALAQETTIIILDEPTAFLDYPSKIEVLKLLKDLVKNHQKTILFSCHDVDLAIEYADKLWCFLKDEIVGGTAKNLVNQKTLDQIFEELSFDEEKMKFVAK